jgi:hypothetical protein
LRRVVSQKLTDVSEALTASTTRAIAMKHRYKLLKNRCRISYCGEQRFSVWLYYRFCGNNYVLIKISLQW